MNNLIRLCMNYSGMRNELTSAEELTVLDLINTEFKTLKAEEVVTAFKMNASGKYWKAVISYQTFSPFFVGEVLGNYKEWLRKANLKPKRVEASHQIENKVDVEHEQKRAFEFIKKYMSKNKGLPIIANWSDAFKYCERMGFINLSIEEKEIQFEQVKKKAKIKINERRMKGEKVNALINQELSTPSLKLECRKLMVIQYLKK